jgi:hypothetical protein
MLLKQIGNLKIVVVIPAGVIEDLENLDKQPDLFIFVVRVGFAGMDELIGLGYANLKADTAI